jgi:hypothetical protein
MEKIILGKDHRRAAMTAAVGTVYPKASKAAGCLPIAFWSSRGDGCHSAGLLNSDKCL